VTSSLRRAGDVQITATASLALFSVVGLAFYGLPLYYDFMVRDFGWSRAMVTSGNAISKLIVGPVFGFAAGWFVDRFGPRRLMMAGILMAGGALIGLGVTSALWMFYLFYVFNALGYVCGGPLPSQVLLTRRFDGTRGRALGIAYVAIGVGGALVPYWSHWLTEWLDWRRSLQALGLIVIAIAFPLVYRMSESGGPAHESSAGPAPIGAVLSQPAFYLLAIGSLCSIAAVGGTNQHLKLFLSLDRGYSQADAARVISLVLTVSIAGRLLMGWLADRVRRKYVMLLIYLLVAGAIPLLLADSSRGLMTPFAVVFGLGLGGEYLIIPLMAAELFGVAVMGRVMGIVLTVDGVAEATAPMIVGYLRDRNGNYDPGFLVLVFTALAGAASIALLPSAPVAKRPMAAGVAPPELSAPTHS
jgi:sugar phosphate permease